MSFFDEKEEQSVDHLIILNRNLAKENQRLLKLSFPVVGKINEIEKLLKVNSMREGVYLTIECDNQFEPHGKASETWELVYTVTLNRLSAYWLSTIGWRKSEPKTPMPMVFKGRTIADCLERAYKFVAWYTIERKEK
jgi:hypothetical protein